MGGGERQSQHLQTLSRLVIRAHCDNRQVSLRADLAHLESDLQYVSGLDATALGEFLALADSHHVTVRGLTALHNVAILKGEKRIADWCAGALASERARVERAIATLHEVCDALEAHGCKVAVIKSLTHWPDLGSDLDLYTTADASQIASVMRDRFDAYPIDRSWGDRLASKWNYKIPGLSELVEIHVRFLGQTGEFAEFARRVIARGVTKKIGGRDLPVPAAEECIILATLQRMYRHFYFRLCDMVDMCSMLQTEAVDYDELKEATSVAGIWPGVVTFLTLVKHYIESYGGALSLPGDVVASARRSGNGVRFKNGYLRVAKTTAAKLYATQLFRAGMRHDARALSRLPLLPPLAMCALVAQRLTGSDKGIW
jgi:hypothetical protein